MIRVRLYYRLSNGDHDSFFIRIMGRMPSEILMTGEVKELDFDFEDKEYKLLASACTAMYNIGRAPNLQHKFLRRKHKDGKPVK